jgi:hypothetical protein
MPKTQVVKVTNVRTLTPQMSGSQLILGGRVPFQDSQLSAGVESLPPEAGQWIPSEPEVGDKITKEGFVDLLSLNEYGYVPDPQAGREGVGNNLLKLETYCLVQISKSSSGSVEVMEFRILYSNPTGEKLATSMSVVAALKDAFIHRVKVRVHAEARQLNAGIGGLPMKSDIFFALQAVELLRT